VRKFQRLILALPIESVTLLIPSNSYAMKAKSTVMKKSLSATLIALCGMSCLSAVAAPAPAKPDPALVARYQADPNLLKAKIAECKKKDDFTAIITDVSCVSADEVGRIATRQSLASKCDGSETFVYIPADLKGPAKEAYLRKHTPSDAALKTCNQTKEQWLQGYLKK
jgi:hypothetical protein